jgi:DNA-binding transcriptional MerR regulator
VLIGELCRQTEMTKDTIRFYEKMGLLPQVKRRENGYKEYTLSDVKQLKLLKHSKELGFTLNEIKDLATLFRADNLDIKEMNQYLLKKEHEIDEKIKKLKAFKKEIKLTLEGQCMYKNMLF